MQTITTIGLDIAKSVFQVHGIDAVGQVVIRRQLKRRLRSCRHAWLGLRLARGPRRSGSLQASGFGFPNLLSEGLHFAQ
jgi:hypothetical protein